MVAYMDSSAAVKLVHREVQTDALLQWLNSQASLRMMSSVLIEIELNRALLRYDPEALPRVPGVLARIARIELHAAVRAAASAYRQPLLRSLDAIHLATANSLSAGVDAFVTYDARLASVAHAEHFDVVMPH